MTITAAPSETSPDVPGGATLAPQTTWARTFGVMLARDLRVLRRELLTFISRTVMQPLLFVFVFAYVLPKIGPAGASPFAAGAGGVSFSTVLVPGMVAVSATMSGMMSVIFPLMMELSWTKEITDRALAPLPIWGLGLQKIVSGAIQALIGALVVFPVVLFVHAGGQAPQVHVTDWPLFLLILVLAALLSAALGLFLGSVIDPRKANVLFTVIMLPATMLGCVYYPWAALDSIRWLQVLVLANPIVYVSEGLRATLTPSLPHMNPWAFTFVLLTGVVVLGWLGARSFTRRVLT